MTERAITDLGGLPGGAIDTHEHEPTLTERRVDAMMMLMRAKPRAFWGSDENRRTIESLTPEFYEGRGEFLRNAQARRADTIAVLLIERAGGWWYGAGLVRGVGSCCGGVPVFEPPLQVANNERHERRNSVAATYGLPYCRLPQRTVPPTRIVNGTLVSCLPYLQPFGFLRSYAGTYVPRCVNTWRPTWSGELVVVSRKLPL